tara:strand:- start:58642 stop:59157 length:516 start_codon:yes stop_codon:yes gene_type:complete
MTGLPKQIGRMLLFIIAQGLIFGQLEFGWGIHPMVYPLFILMLPFDTRPVVLMVVAFFTGLGVDFFMNTFGLHASAALLIAYIRPELFRLFSPRDGYDSLKEPSMSEWGVKWFIQVAGITIVIHHVWFFLLEYFKWSAWTEILQSSILSSIVTLVIFIVIQVLFFKKPKKV